MNSNDKRKSVIFIFITISFITTLAAACQQNSTFNSDAETEQAREPKTSFGQNIKRTKDLSKDLAQHDQQIAEQAEEILILSD